jgi:hypothetical protein
MKHPPGLENALSEIKKCLTSKMKLDNIRMPEDKKKTANLLLVDKCRWLKARNKGGNKKNM